MADQARKKTDQELEKLEREIYELYATSQVEISEKWRKYMSSHEKKLNALYASLEEAKKSGDKDTIAKAKEEYERAVKNVTLNDKRYKAMLNETTAKLAHVNEVALDYVNGNMPKIYTLNYNEFANQDIDGYTFTLVNEQAVKNLATEDKSLLPKKKLDIPKDKQWNQKNINSEVLQGILQGENITKIANRLGHVTDMNRSSAIRNARTMTTAAENKGRQDSFKKAQDDGVIMEREWVATTDERTRAWHADLDGVEVDLDEPWENEYGEIMYPGDPNADPCNVYNCRCSIRAIVKGFKGNEEIKDEDVDENGLTLAEQGELMSYKSFDYYAINDTLREEGFEELDERQKEKVEILDSALSKLPTYSGDLSRSLYFNDEESLKDYIQSVQESGKLDSPAYLSTTKNTEELYNPDGQVQIFINDSKKARDLEGYDNGENEALYERNAHIDIIEQGWKDDTYVIIAKEREE